MAITQKEIQNGFEAFFTTANELRHELSVPGREGRLSEAILPCRHVPALMIGEMGISSIRPTQQTSSSSSNELHLQRRPMLLTNNEPIVEWEQSFHDADVAEAALNRVLERGPLLHPRGPSCCTRQPGQPSASSPSLVILEAQSGKLGSALISETFNGDRKCLGPGRVRRSFAPMGIPEACAPCASCNSGCTICGCSRTGQSPWVSCRSSCSCAGILSDLALHAPPLRRRLCVMPGRARTFAWSDRHLL